MSDAKPLSRAYNGAFVPAPGVYALDPVHTFTEFSAQHLIIGRVRGRFDQAAGTATVADDPTASSLEVTIQTASVNTRNATRDEDLRSARFFDVERFPTMAYPSTAFVAELDGRWTVEGNPTIRDVTVALPLTVEIAGAVVDPRGATRVGIHVRAHARRRDFGLLADLDRESGGVALGKDVTIAIDAEALLRP